MSYYFLDCWSMQFKESLFTMTTAADEIEDKMREIRISNEKLETEKAELEAKLASLWRTYWLSDFVLILSNDGGDLMYL